MAIPVWCDVCSNRSWGEPLVEVHFADYKPEPARVEREPPAPLNSPLEPPMLGSGPQWRPPPGALMLCPVHLDRAAELRHLTAEAALATLNEEFSAFSSASKWKRGLLLLRGTRLRPHPVPRRRT